MHGSVIFLGTSAILGSGWSFGVITAIKGNL